jgi:3-dehydroquinate dehydratase type I
MKICVPIQVRTQKEAKKALQNIKGKADMAEIWLDHIRDLNVSDLLKNKPLPVICVCKKPDEKGRFKGTNKEVIKVLAEASKLGADYIDVPLNICDLRFEISDSKFKNLKSKIIISYHNFTKTPPTSVLLKTAEDIKKMGADIVKISVMAKSLNDTIRMIILAKILQFKKIPHILIAMGKKGVLSRVLTPTLGGTIMFAPLSRSRSSAPGQLTVGELREAWNLLKT